MLRSLVGSEMCIRDRVSRIDLDSLKPYYVKDFIQAKTLSEAKQQFLTLKDGVYKLSVPFHIESFDHFKNIDKEFAIKILKSIAEKVKRNYMKRLYICIINIHSK